MKMTKKKERIRICRDPEEAETVEELAAAHAAVDLAVTEAALAAAHAVATVDLAATDTVVQEEAFTAARFSEAASTDPDVTITVTDTAAAVLVDCWEF